jgi:hypothetical protein
MCEHEQEAQKAAYIDFNPEGTDSTEEYDALVCHCDECEQAYDDSMQCNWDEN